LQPLLCPVVEIALETPALGVASLDEPRARGGELLSCIRVRQRLRDQLGEAEEALLGPLGERFLTSQCPVNAGSR
jgi:hypothetical protein